jgi:hypothetical protein
MAGNEALVNRIVEIIKSHVNPKQGLSNLSRNQNIAPAIVEIIKRSIPEAPKIVAQAPPDDVVRAIVKAIQNGVELQTSVAGAAVTPMVHGGAPVAPTVAVVKAAPSNNVSRAVVNAIRKGIPVHKDVMNAVVEKKPGFFQKFANLFRPKNKMPINGPNFLNANMNTQGRFKPPPPGYILTTRTNNTGVSKTGWFKNTGPSGPIGPVGPPPPRNYTKMSIRELLDAMRKYPENRSVITEALRKAVEKELRDIRYEYSKSRRVRKLGDLLRLLPRNYSGRRNASSIVVNDVRNTRNARELLNVRSNLGSVPNENIRRAFEEQRRRFERNRTTTEAGRGRVAGRYTPSRRYGESNNNYYRRVKSTDNQRELMELMRRRRAARIGGIGNEGSAGRSFGGNGNGAPPPLPENQRQAINNVGGVNKAMNTVVQVPGGAPEIAKAAEALNESGGNSTIAIRVKGVSPAAVNAVQKLGGPNNAVTVLEGLNTMSQTHATRKRKGTRRTKKVLRPRVAELNRVINAVKKQRLISLVAHNVTKTHNIHPNDEKLKKYYKKVIKANILRTPFAKIAKSAAKKRE